MDGNHPESALSGWFPSMMIVGFYAQAFYLLVPAILYLFWFEERPVLRTLLVGMLGYVLLAQTGNALLAIAWFCALARAQNQAMASKAFPVWASRT